MLPLQNTFHRSFLTFSFSLLLVLTISSCRDDDEQPTISEYDPDVHVYAMEFKSRVGQWEAIIDITTGAYDTIPGTKESAGAIFFPNGTAVLTDFPNNRRIFLNRAQVPPTLIVQDLTTLEKSIIPLEPAGESLITAPEFLTFGADNNTVYVFDVADDAIYVADLVDQTFRRLVDDLPLYSTDLEAILYQEGSNDLLFLERENYYILDLDTDEFKSGSESLPNLFGYVSHNDLIYALTYPDEDRVFRLVQLERTGDELTAEVLSVSDLAVDNLSPNLQTIHTATNSYVCRGGISEENNIENFIYSIDLSSGELLRTVTLNGFEVMTKLRGE